MRCTAAESEPGESFTSPVEGGGSYGNGDEPDVVLRRDREAGEGARENEVARRRSFQDPTGRDQGKGHEERRHDVHGREVRVAHVNG